MDARGAPDAEKDTVATSELEGEGVCRVEVAEGIVNGFERRGVPTICPVGDHPANFNGTVPQVVRNASQPYRFRPRLTRAAEGA